MSTHAKPDHFFQAIEHCIACKFSTHTAILMANGFARRGMVDASDGCVHYAMMLMGGET